MTPLETIEVNCPYCGQRYDTVVDCSAGEQEYVEDCEICCRPILFRLSVDGVGSFTGVEARRDDE
jgi:hypothetical protein